MAPNICFFFNLWFLSCRLGSESRCDGPARLDAEASDSYDGRVRSGYAMVSWLCECVRILEAGGLANIG